MMSKRSPSGFENVNSSLPSRQNRSRWFATRLWHQAQSQSPSASSTSGAVRVSSFGWVSTGATGSVSLGAFQFTNGLCRSACSGVKPRRLSLSSRIGYASGPE